QKTASSWAVSGVQCRMSTKTSRRCTTMTNLAGRLSFENNGWITRFSMSKLQITLTDSTKSFVEVQAAQARCTPDEFVEFLLTDAEKLMQRRKLNLSLEKAYRQLRQGLGRVYTEADWKRLEANISGVQRA